MTRPDSDADGVDAFLDWQATGPDIYNPEYAPPHRPRWDELTTYTETEHPSGVTP